MLDLFVPEALDPVVGAGGGDVAGDADTVVSWGEHVAAVGLAGVGGVGLFQGFGDRRGGGVAAGDIFALFLHGGVGGEAPFAVGAGVGVAAGEFLCPRLCDPLQFCVTAEGGEAVFAVGVKRGFCLVVGVPVPDAFCGPEGVEFRVGGAHVLVVAGPFGLRGHREGGGEENEGEKYGGG